MIILFPDKELNSQTDRKLKVHQRITLRHPDIAAHDVETAWRNAVAMRLRTMEPSAHIIAAGADSKGRLIEMIGVELDNGQVLVYHAQKLTAKMQAELGL